MKASIRHHSVALPQRQHLECTAVELHGALGGLLVVAAYKPPQKELLTADLEAVFGAHRRVVIAGDLDCKHPDWGSRLTNRNGERLPRHADTARVSVLGPTQPELSRVNARADVLDVAAVRGVYCPVHVSAMSELSSDHCPISVHIATQHPVVRDERRIIEWERFGPAFSRRLPEQVPLDSTQQVEEAAALFDSLFDSAVVSAMVVSSRMKPGFTPDFQRVPEEVTLLPRAKNRLRRSW